MENDLVKKLTGKNPKDFEFAATQIVNNADSETFRALVEKSEYLFDFIKKNVSKRLIKAVNEKNYKNLISFLNFYSPDYEEFIVSSLAKHADEELTDELLERFEQGANGEKAYCAKYFALIPDTAAIDLLRKNSYSEFDALALNCAQALASMNDEESYNAALEKLKSTDDFEKLSAIRFLVAYNDIKAADVIFEAMKTSSMPENIASEISYLDSFLNFLDSDFKEDTILAVNHVINGLGEIVELSQVFDFQLYEVLDKLIELQKDEKSGKIAVVLLNAKEKLDQLTENDEYIFDEEKDTKEEIFEIKRLLNSQLELFWSIQKDLCLSELNEGSNFVYSVLELVQELKITNSSEKLKELLHSLNQTVVLRTLEVIKSLDKISEINKDEVLAQVSDENIKAIIESLFI